MPAATRAKPEPTPQPTGKQPAPSELQVRRWAGKPGAARPRAIAVAASTPSSSAGNAVTSIGTPFTVMASNTSRWWGESSDAIVS